MSLPGFGIASPLRKYESYESLKRHVNSGLGSKYDIPYTYEIIKHGVTLTTGATPLEMLSIENGAVSFIGKTELTLVGAFGEDNGDNNDFVATLVYKDQDGTQHTATCTVTEDHNDTEVAFVKTSDGTTEVTDYYCSVSCSSNQAVAAGDTFGWGATGALTKAAGGGTIAAETSAATELTMGGVGNIYGFSTTDHEDADGSVLHLDYMTPWGEVKRGATCTYATDSAEHVIFYESDAATTVKDFYRVISLVTTKTTTANGHEGLIGDSDAADNGGGGDIYGCINELTDGAVIMRMTAPHDDAGSHLYLGKIMASATSGGGASADYYQVIIKFTAYGDSIEKTWRTDFDGHMEVEPAILLEPDTDVTFYVADIGDPAPIGLTVWYILAKEI